MDLTITSSVAEASDALRHAIQNFVDRKSDVAPWVKQAVAADPDCAMAHATQGLVLHQARHNTLRPMLEEAQQHATRLAPQATPREQAYVAALEACVQGDLLRAISHYETILEDDLTDIFALALCQSELFWLGEMRWSENVSARVASRWSAAMPGYPAFLAIRAFDLEEVGQYRAAESCGRECIDHEPGNVWGAHAVAHVLLMQNRADEGIDWLNALQSNWSDANQLKFHLWWHHCLFDLERRDTAAALDVYDRWVRNRDDPLVQELPDLYIDLQNGASLLWRLEHVGIDVGDRWHEMAELVQSRLEDMTSPFTSAHFAIILAAVGDVAACQTLLDNMRSFTAETVTLATPYAAAALPAAQAAVAHRKGDHVAVVETLFPARRQLWRMGGSHAQQDVFLQMLFDSATRSGRQDVAGIVLHDLEMMGFTEPHRRVAYAIASSNTSTASG